MSIVREAFDTHARTVRRGFFKGRSEAVGASEIGLCARQVWYNKHKTEPDHDYIDAWGASKRGTVFESRFFVPAMRKKYGKKLLHAGGDQLRLVHKTLSATPDGLLVDQPSDLLAGLMVPDIGPSHCVVIDCKTIDPRINLSQPKPNHVFQIIVQLGLLRMKTKYKPDYGVLIYTNASFYDDTVEFVVRHDQEKFEHAQRRANQIMISSQASDLKPEGWIAGGDECKYCAYAKSCRSIRGAVPENDEVATDPQFIEELAELARLERAEHDAVEAAQKGQREVQEKIKARLREKGLRFVKDSGISVSWASVKGRLSYDMPKVKAAAVAAGVDLQQFETVGDPTDRLTVQVTSHDRLIK